MVSGFDTCPSNPSLFLAKFTRFEVWFRRVLSCYILCFWGSVKTQFFRLHPVFSGFAPECSSKWWHYENWCLYVYMCIHIYIYITSVLGRFAPNFIISNFGEMGFLRLRLKSLILERMILDAGRPTIKQKNGFCSSTNCRCAESLTNPTSSLNSQPNLPCVCQGPFWDNIWVVLNID